MRLLGFCHKIFHVGLGILDARVDRLGNLSDFLDGLVACTHLLELGDSASVQVVIGRSTRIARVDFTHGLFGEGFLAFCLETAAQDIEFRALFRIERDSIPICRIVLFLCHLSNLDDWLIGVGLGQAGTQAISDIDLAGTLAEEILQSAFVIQAVFLRMERFLVSRKGFLLVLGRATLAQNVIEHLDGILRIVNRSSALVQVVMADGCCLLDGSSDALDTELRVLVVEERVCKFPVVRIILIGIAFSIAEEFLRDFLVFFFGDGTDIGVGNAFIRGSRIALSPEREEDALVQFRSDLVALFWCEFQDIGRDWEHHSRLDDRFFVVARDGIACQIILRSFLGLFMADERGQAFGRTVSFFEPLRLEGFGVWEAFGMLLFIGLQVGRDIRFLFFFSDCFRIERYVKAEALQRGIGIGALGRETVFFPKSEIRGIG